MLRKNQAKPTPRDSCARGSFDVFSTNRKHVIDQQCDNSVMTRGTILVWIGISATG
jgi:hypothetical protein